MKPRRPLILPVLLLALCGPATGASAPPIGDVLAAEFALQEGDMATAARYYLLAAQVSPDPGIAERAARIALLDGQDRLAERAVTRWRALAPESLAMRAAAISLALRLGEHETAMEEAAVLLGQPEQGYPVLLLALSEARGDEKVIARSVMTELFRQDQLPANLSAWLRFATLARRLGDRPFSTRILDAGLARFPDDPQAQLLKIARLREGGQLTAARAQLLALRASGQLPPDLRRAAASEMARLGEPGVAADILAEGPQDDASFGQRASWLVVADDRPGLVVLYGELARLPEPSAQLRLLQGHVAEALERWDDAERWYRGVAGPGRDLALLRLARVLENVGRLPEALDLLHELQADEASDGERIRDSYLYEAELIERDGRPGEALAALDRGLAVFEDDPVLLYARAMQHERGDDVDAALADLRRIIDDNPEDAHALNAYGYTLAERRGEYARALPYVQRALVLDPTSAPILDSLGWIQYRLGQREKSLELLERAWSQLKDPEIAAHLGEVLWAFGRRDEAREIWRQGSDIDPTNPALVKVLEKHRP